MPKAIKGFTLIEIILVIIIVAALMSLALPKFFSLIEYSRGKEALQSMGDIHQAVEHCRHFTNGTYVGCDLSHLDIENPANSTGSHFSYSITVADADNYTLKATRNTFDNGDGTSTILFTQTASDITKSGTSVFAALK